ncbi:Adhesion G-protein coupled receptor D1 [Holothuria leucospilota]|uniref:Adhesion G-protein coupled receptor D1 n=1 Tax=Holothuria leucospilota TaxID=206669 RepID=A0A9Q0YU43_HOLLE|nr:Adhesion G-protein coupled receptor D1 [Holothuria leucospilota]
MGFVPLAFVFISIICITIQESKSQKFFRDRKSKPCFFSYEDGSIWYFLVPVLLVILINTGILVRINIIVVKAAKLQAGRDSSPALYQAKAGLRSALLLIPLLGCAYILGFLTSFHGVFEIMYNIINSLQGFFISLFYCLMNKEIRAAIGKFIQRSQEMSTIQASTTGTTGVTLPLRKLYMRNKIEPAEEPAEGFQEAPVRESAEEPPRMPPACPAEILVEHAKEQLPEALWFKPQELSADETAERLVKEPQVKGEEKPRQQQMEIGAEDPESTQPEMHLEGPLGEPTQETIDEPPEKIGVRATRSTCRCTHRNALGRTTFKH